jgi:hypothetical protein
MARSHLGMKVYDNDWYLKYDLSYAAAAELLSDWGVTFVIAQSRLLPMPDSAVKSEVPPELAERYATYDDRKFRDALAVCGIEYYASALMFFDPAALRAEPSFEAIGSDGLAMPTIDWYVGIPPTKQGHVANKIRAIERAVRALEPDGIHLGFTRWPGFWELWLPHHQRHDFPEYSFDRESLEQFSAATGTALPTRAPKAAAAWIEAHARDAWTDWKCRVVVDVIRAVRDAGRRIKPDLRVLLNTVPFGAADFDNAEEKVFGQRFEDLADVVDLFEVMTYHQILKRSPAWIATSGDEVKARTGRTTVCTLQAEPLYLAGIHARENRSSTLDLVEFEAAVASAVGSSADGVVFFVWSDFLRQVKVEGDLSRVEVIRRVRGRDS